MAQKRIGDLVLQRLPFEEEGLPISVVDLEDRANVLVIQACGCLRFPDEADLVFGIFDGVLGKLTR